MVFVYFMSVLLTAMVVFQWMHPSAAAAAQVTAASPVESNPYPRLPTDVVPVMYRIKLIPYLSEGNFTTSGEVWIKLNVSSPSDNITVHIKDMIIIENEVTVTDSDAGEDVPVAHHSYNKKLEMYSVFLAETLQTGTNYEFYIRFSGILNDVLQGFYRSKYVDQKTGQTRWLASTQFSPTDARRAFPCFDEPAFKAQFQISLARPANLSTLSNMPLDQTEASENMPGWYWDHYPPTLPMSTYLVAFVVSDLKGQVATLGSSRRKSAITKSDVQFRVWARGDALQQTQYAGRIGPRMLRYLESYFGIAFPLPKQDMVALPDFGFSAMENWGLITFRESSMLYDVNVSTAINKASVASVIGHELAHQWFGNLVTPMWWNDLWLKEGFATFLGQRAVAYVEPTWRVDQQFIQRTLQMVFGLDALESSHPISVPVDNPDQIRQIFDSISYSKGASIIRMMSHFLGEDTFRAGLTNYLQIHKYNNARQDDLWAALTTQAHHDGSLPTHVTVQIIMDTWTLQTGYPVVTIERDYDKQSATVSQELFRLVSTSNNTQENSNTTWWVPLTFTSQNAPDFNTTRPSFWLENATSIEIEGLPDDKNWVIFNIQETGYYRVNYDKANWKMLMADYQSLPDMARTQLLDDALNLARAGCLDYTTALDLVHQLKGEMEYLPLAAALKAIEYLTDMLALSPAYGNFKVFMLGVIDHMYNKLEFEERPTDTHLERLNRINILKWACNLGHEQCIWHSRAKFRLWMSQENRKLGSNPISPNQKETVYCTAIKHGGSDEWNFAWKKYLSANVGSEKEQLLDALGCSNQPWLLNRYLNWMLSNDSGIRKQDGSRVFSSVNKNVMGHSLAFNFLRNNWEDVLDYYGVAFSSVSKMVAELSKYMNTPLQLAELKKFRDENEGQLGTSARSFEQTIEKVEANIRWMDNSYVQVEEWLKKHSSLLATLTY